MDDMKLRVRVVPGDDGYWVSECVDLPGCMSQGRTMDEALQNLVEAISGVLEARIERGMSEHQEGEREFELAV